MPWSDKLPVAIWRGAATGTINDRRQAGRYHLLTRWAHSLDPRVDVGMTFLPISTNNATRDASLRATAKPSVGRSSMLQYRYLISAEGYDVATNLKWALWSASAVIMPRPTVCSWLMEDRLVPWVHYVPVAADFSNLTDAVDWCEAGGNAGVCQRIGAAGRAYMEEHRFMDVEADLELGRAVAAAAVRSAGRSVRRSSILSGHEHGKFDRRSTILSVHDRHKSRVGGRGARRRCARLCQATWPLYKERPVHADARRETGGEKRKNPFLVTDFAPHTRSEPLQIQTTASVHRPTRTCPTSQSKQSLS